MEIRSIDAFLGYWERIRGRTMFVENACGGSSRYPGHGRELADGRDDVLAFLDRCRRIADRACVDRSTGIA